MFIAAVVVGLPVRLHAGDLPVLVGHAGHGDAAEGRGGVHVILAQDC